MSVQAYWNTYLGPTNAKNEEWEYPAQEVAEQMERLADIEREAAHARGIETTVRNDGKNLELELSGSVYRVIKFLHDRSRTVPAPFLVYVDSKLEKAVVIEELTDYGDTHIDVEIRKE